MRKNKITRFDAWEDSAMANIFEAYWSASGVITKNPDVYTSPEYARLLKAVKVYFDSFSWVGNEADRLIYLYSGKGLNTSAIAAYIGINENTYRSKVSRISAKLSGILFRGSRLPDVCLSSNADTVKSARVYIESLNNRLVIGKELSGYMLDKILAVTADSDLGQSVTEKEKFQALFLVASFSEPVIENKMSEVNPAALAVVMDELFGSECSEWSRYYRKMQSKVFHLQMPPPNIIDFCKSE